MAEVTQTAQVVKEMAEYGIEVLGISETRWKGMGSTTLQSSVKVMYIGDEEVQQGGVAITTNARAERALMEWTPISKRIIKVQFYSKYKKLTVIQMCAPMNDVMDEEKDEFYNQLQDTISSFNRHDMIVLMGNLNTRIGSNNANREEVVGKFGVGVMNDSREKLCDFCSANGLVITGTLFPHKEMHKLTWRSPDGKSDQLCYGEWAHENISPGH